MRDLYYRKGEKPSVEILPNFINKQENCIICTLILELSHYTDKRINKLLSGLNGIVSAIVKIRNKDSDAHEVGRLPLMGIIYDSLSMQLC